MKKSSIILATALVLFSACRDNDTTGTEERTGSVTFSVTAKQPEEVTRAGEAISTADFAVSVQGLGDLQKVKYDYATVGDVPSSLPLVVGEYSVTAHSAGEITRQMTKPYYGATKNFAVNFDVQTKVDLVCKMMNSRITINLDDDFKAKYKDWTITINDGSDQVLAYTETSSYEPIYWYFVNDTKELVVDIRATTVDGSVVYATNTYTKSSCKEAYTDIDNENFTGGDAINITFTPATAPLGYVKGVNIDADITFENTDETVSVQVKDNGADDDPKTPEDPEPTPGGDDIVVNFVNGNAFTVAAYTATTFPTVQVDFTFPTGLENLYVKVTGSSFFESMCSAFGLTEGDGVDLSSDAASELGALFELPKKGDGTYQFSLNETLWQLLAVEPGFPGTQKFTLKAVDKNGKTASGTLTINIKE